MIKLGATSCCCIASKTSRARSGSSPFSQALIRRQEYLQGALWLPALPLHCHAAPPRLPRTPFSHALAAALWHAAPADWDREAPQEFASLLASPTSPPSPRDQRHHTAISATGSTLPISADRPSTCQHTRRLSPATLARPPLPAGYSRAHPRQRCGASPHLASRHSAPSSHALVAAVYLPCARSPRPAGHSCSFLRAPFHCEPFSHAHVAPS